MKFLRIGHIGSNTSQPKRFLEKLCKTQEDSQVATLCNTQKIHAAP